MGQHAMVADRDSKRGEEIHSHENRNIVPGHQPLPEQPDRADDADERGNHTDECDSFFEPFVCHMF
jgi:hypothetical protein